MKLTRRTVLRGLGATVALPWLEAMTPLAMAGGNATRSNLRVAWFYVPNGAHMADWTPAKEGAGLELPYILEPLQPVKDDLLVLTGLTADKARANGDGPGDHARALSAFLTGCQPRKTDGADIRAGISVDQVAAGRIGDQTRLPSLEIGGERGAMAGNCDSGYSCVYSSTMSWRSATSPMPKEVDPRLLFDRLFGSSLDASLVQRNARRKSILDFVQDDASSLRRDLGARDARKIDEYFSSVRDLELRIARAEKLPPVKAPSMTAPKGIPASYDEHLRLLCDLMVLAFQADITRVMTFVMANEGSNRPYPMIKITEGHHDLSHHGHDKAKQTKIREINRFHMSQFAYLVKCLKDTQEGDGSLLDHCMFAYGSGNSDGNAHNHEDLPIVVVGKACGSLKTGRHLRYPKDTPLNNLWLEMLDRTGANLDRLGDSTGRLPGLV